MRAVTAAVSRESDKPLAIEQLQMNGPQAGEIVVEISAVGICHTDIGSHMGLLGTSKPIVLGHEGAGIVVETGDGVTSLAPGDHVLLTSTSCGRCRSCLGGHQAYCQSVYELNALGDRPDGSSAFEGDDVHSHFFGQSSFADYAMAGERNAVKLDDDLPLEIAAPLGCGIMTGAGTVFLSLGVRPGSSIAIFGAGAVGLSAVMAAGIAGASTIIAVDVVPDRLRLAEELGATHCIDAALDDSTKVVRDVTGGGADYTIEASGVAAGLAGAIESVGVRGTCAVVGTAGVGVQGSFDWLSLIVNGASIRGVTVGDANPRLLVPQLIAHYKAGRFPFDRLLSFHPFAEINEAIGLAGTGHAIKPVLRVR